VKVFLSGGEGSIGSSLRRCFNSQNIAVCLIDTPYKKHEIRFSNESRISIDEKNSSSNFESENIFIHVAGLSHVGKCEANPTLAHQANVELTKDCLEFARLFNCRLFVFLSTGFLYGDKSFNPHSENSEIILSNRYLETKYLAENVIKELSSRFGISSVILRLGNVYGPSSSAETVIGRIITQLKNGLKELEIFSKKPVRDFLFVEDLNTALMQVISKTPPSSFEVYNLSFGQAVSVKDIFDACQEQVGLIRVKETNPDLGFSYLVLDSEKFKNQYSWVPRFSISKGLSELLS
jgi:UDP-glucose 4-epimerase